MGEERTSAIGHIKDPDETHRPHPEVRSEAEPRRTIQSTLPVAAAALRPNTRPDR